MAQQFEVVFLGTGSPLPSPDRCGSGQVVAAGGQNLLVDCGWGAARRLLPAGIGPATVDTVCFTHMHTDHITDFPDFLFLRWTAGAQRPLRVFGPEGTREVVEGFLQALRQDIAFRQKHHGDKLAPEGVRVEVTELPATAAATPFATLGDGLMCESFEVNHFPVVPAFGYRFRFDGRAAVLSGDTTFCEPLLQAAEGADLLVCEALNVEMLGAWAAALRAAGRTTAASLMDDVPSYHLPTLDAAKLARDAGVRTLALSHLIPPIPNDGPQAARFLAGMDRLYPGVIHLARDGERFAVPSSPEV